MLSEALRMLHPFSTTGQHHYVEDVSRRVLQTICAVHGHELMLHYERGRICLRCIDCGHETTGWSLTDHQGRLER